MKVYLIRKVKDIDIQYELSKAKQSSEKSPIENLLKEAVKIAYDYINTKSLKL